MTRYYFHVRNHGFLEEDIDGADFSSVEAARDEALKAGREIIAEKVLADDVINGHCFDITAEDGEVVSLVPFRSALRLESSALRLE